MVSSVLRDLPGVAELEARLRSVAADPNPLKAPEAKDLERDVDNLSKRLFGITEADTDFDPEAGDYSRMPIDQVHAAWDVWNAQFDEIGGTPEEIIASFAALGWDVTDGQGDVLKALDKLDCQILAVAKGLVPKLPRRGFSDAEPVERSEVWSANLTADAGRFRR